MEDLANLQNIVNLLICNLIIRGDKHQAKGQILKEIDEAIEIAVDNAYQF